MKAGGKNVKPVRIVALLALLIAAPTLILSETIPVAEAHGGFVEPAGYTTDNLIRWGLSHGETFAAAIDNPSLDMRCDIFGLPQGCAPVTWINPALADINNRFSTVGTVCPSCPNQTLQNMAVISAGDASDSLISAQVSNNFFAVNASLADVLPSKNFTAFTANWTINAPVNHFAMSIAPSTFGSPGAGIQQFWITLIDASGATQKIFAGPNYACNFNVGGTPFSPVHFSTNFPTVNAVQVFINDDVSACNFPGSTQLTNSFSQLAIWGQGLSVSQASPFIDSNLEFGDWLTTKGTVESGGTNPGTVGGAGVVNIAPGTTSYVYTGGQTGTSTTRGFRLNTQDFPVCLTGSYAGAGQGWTEETSTLNMWVVTSACSVWISARVYTTSPSPAFMFTNTSLLPMNGRVSVIPSVGFCSTCGNGGSVGNVAVSYYSGSGPFGYPILNDAFNSDLVSGNWDSVNFQFTATNVKIAEGMQLNLTLNPFTYYGNAAFLTIGFHNASAMSSPACPTTFNISINGGPVVGAIIGRSNLGPQGSNGFLSFCTWLVDDFIRSAQFTASHIDNSPPATSRTYNIKFSNVPAILLPPNGASSTGYFIELPKAITGNGAERFSCTSPSTSDPINGYCYGQMDTTGFPLNTGPVITNWAVRTWDDSCKTTSGPAPASSLHWDTLAPNLNVQTSTTPCLINPVTQILVREGTTGLFDTTHNVTGFPFIDPCASQIGDSNLPSLWDWNTVGNNGGIVSCGFLNGVSTSNPSFQFSRPGYPTNYFNFTNILVRRFVLDVVMNHSASAPFMGVVGCGYDPSADTQTCTIGPTNDPTKACNQFNQLVLTCTVLAPGSQGRVFIMQCPVDGASLKFIPNASFIETVTGASARSPSFNSLQQPSSCADTVMSIQSSTVNMNIAAVGFRPINFQANWISNPQIRIITNMKTSGGNIQQILTTAISNVTRVGLNGQQLTETDIVLSDIAGAGTVCFASACPSSVGQDAQASAGIAALGCGIHLCDAAGRAFWGFLIFMVMVGGVYIIFHRSEKITAVAGVPAFFVVGYLGLWDPFVIIGSLLLIVSLAVFGVYKSRQGA